MTRKHRVAHRLFWPALGIVVAIAFLFALVQRAPAALASAPHGFSESQR
jgi:hypothetical protein